MIKYKSKLVMKVAFHMSINDSNVVSLSLYILLKVLRPSQELTDLGAAKRVPSNCNF